MVHPHTRAECIPNCTHDLYLRLQYASYCHYHLPHHPAHGMPADASAATIAATATAAVTAAPPEHDYRATAPAAATAVTTADVRGAPMPPPPSPLLLPLPAWQAAAAGCREQHILHQAQPHVPHLDQQQRQVGHTAVAGSRSGPLVLGRVGRGAAARGGCEAQGQVGVAAAGNLKVGGGWQRSTAVGSRVGYCGGAWLGAWLVG